MGRQIGHYGRLPVAAVALAILLSLTHGQTALAQGNSRSPGYWQYATSGRLDNVVTADVDGDGIDEFLVLDENGQLSLLSADGLQPVSYTHLNDFHYSLYPICFLGDSLVRGEPLRANGCFRDVAIVAQPVLTRKAAHGRQRPLGVLPAALVLARSRRQRRQDAEVGLHRLEVARGGMGDVCLLYTSRCV